MINENKKQSRRRFIEWGVASAAFFSAVKFLLPTNNKKKETVKMLTADGKLVEVDKAVFDEATKKAKASNKEIYAWMNNPSKEKNS